MATAQRRRSAAIQVRRSTPMVSRKKLDAIKTAAFSKAKRGREIAARRTGTIVGAAIAGGAGYLERTGKVSPKFTSPVAFAGIGILLAFVAPETSLGKGKLGQSLAEGGSALLAVGAYKAGLGQAMIGADDDIVGGDDDTVSGAWSDG